MPDTTTNGDGPGRAAPLAGIRVADFTRVFSGPYATAVLADLGAEVIKIEPLGTGDEARDYGERADSGLPGPPFIAMNCSKFSVALDLKDPGGLQAARRIVRGADVVVENFRPGVMERLGLGYDEVRDGHEDLVYCSISGFGSRGPLAGRAANDLSIQALSGLLSMTGEPGGGPVRTPAAVGDLTAGMFATIGVLAALLERGRSGRGQHVETSMYEGQVSLLGYFLTDYALHGTVPERMGSANRLGLPNQAFATSDGWVCVTASNDRAFARLCEALGIPGLAEDERFRTLQARYRNREDLVARLAERVESLGTAECVELLDRAGVSNSPVRTIGETAAEPQLEAMGLVQQVPVPGLGPVPVVGSPLHLSETPLLPRRTPPRLGQDTEAVLARFGGEEVTA